MQQAQHEWRAAADEIWTILRENASQQAEIDRIMKENGKDLADIKASQKETDRIMKENTVRYAEIDRILKETAVRQAETDRIMKENGKLIGKLGNRFGEMVEHMVLPNLLTKFNELDLPFTKAYSDTKITDKKHGIHTEVDAFLENGDKAMIVEIKTKPDIDDIDYHVERMEKLRKYADLRGDERKYLGAVAGVVFGEGEKNYAFKKGFYVIEPSGETFNITAPAGSPREW